jgi:CDGSH-type Zn-finger protein
MALYDKNKPYVIKEEPGLKTYCACGLTEEPPYCDGSHNGKNTGKRPYLVKIETEQVVSICGCGRSAKLPFCDGTHKTRTSEEQTV